VVFDVAASRVFGLVTARDARVVWADGVLYVARSPTDVAAFSSEKPPRRRSGVYEAQVGEAMIRIQPATCGSCKRRILASPVGQMSVQAVIDAVAAVGADG